jgi:hypothetical protein
MTEIRIPFVDRSQPLDAEALDLPRHLDDPQERRVVTQVIADAMATPGMETMGDLLRAFDCGGGRELVNTARTNAGLPTIESEEAARAYEARRRAHTAEAPRDHAGRTPGVCCHSGCSNYLVDPAFPGGPGLTKAARWACTRHADEGDFSDWGPARLIVGPSGAFVDPVEQARDAARDAQQAERRRVRREAEQAERRKEAEEQRRYEEARLEQLRRQTPPGMPIP